MHILEALTEAADGSSVKEFTSKPNDLSSDPGLTWYKERSNLQKLSSEFYTGTITPCKLSK